MGEGAEYTLADKSRIVKCLGQGIHTDDVDIEQLWFIAADGVDHFLPDMVNMSVKEDGPSLSGERRSFEISRRVVDAINLLLFGTGNTMIEDPPDSLSDQDYDSWVAENENIMVQYTKMGYDFLSDAEYDSPQVYQNRSDGTFYTWMGDVCYKLVETGETRVAKWRGHG